MHPELTMELVLHLPDAPNALSARYRQAFGEAQELFLVSAYLTEWNSTLELNQHCQEFRVIVGADFGITTPEACTALMRWVPTERRKDVLVAELPGFHPKAVFWSDARGNSHVV